MWELNVQCDVEDTSFKTCDRIAMNESQCSHATGIICDGMQKRNKLHSNVLYYPSLQLHVSVQASQTAESVEVVKAVKLALPATATPTAMNMATAVLMSPMYTTV